MSYKTSKPFLVGMAVGCFSGVEIVVLMIGCSAGLKKGDHILKINNWPVESADDLYKLLKALMNSGDLVVTIERD